MDEQAHQALTVAITEAAQQRIVPPIRRAPVASVRASHRGYLAVASALTYAAFLLLRVEYDLIALTALTVAWVIMPLLAFTDRVSFDGHVLSRKGLTAFMMRLTGGRTLNLKIDEIERVETIAVRTLRRNGRVHYRYRSEVAGKGLNFNFASGGNGYRLMVRSLFPLIPEEKVDTRSLELREYLSDAKSLRAMLGLLSLAPPVVLENATLGFEQHSKKKVRHQRLGAGAPLRADDFERGRLLRRAANELRIAGRLRESAEAFRRALLVTPREGGLIYEFARLLRSQASSSGDARLLARSRAGLRLAARCGTTDAALLTRIGESFFEHGYLDYATRSFRRALELEPRGYRAALGLAEVALRNGKLAHAIHHYADAARIAPDAALARFARGEADYYARLNNDDDYLAAELRRINRLQHLQSARRIAARITLASILLALFGPFIEESFGSVGWSLASSSIIAWLGVTILSGFFARRRKASTTE